MRAYLMTPNGREALEKELVNLREVERFKIVKDIAEARAHGDISENSEYEDAKERQALCEGRIKDITAKLSLVEVIDVLTVPGQGLASDHEDKKVVFGSTILLEDDDGKEHSFRIVGTDESNVSKGWISYQTPVAKALLGRSPGDDVTVTLPNKTRSYEILEVYYK